MLHRARVVAVVVLALASSAMAVLPAGAKTNDATVTHKLVVAVKKTLPPAAEKKLAVLVLVSQSGGPPAGAVATASKALTIHLANRGVYRVKAEIDTSCKGSCAASYRIPGSGNHKLEVVPSCRLKGAVFVCSKIKILRIY